MSNLRLLFGTVLLLLLVGCLESPPPEGMRQLIDHFEHAGLKRDYTLLLPDGLGCVPAPLVVALHGGGGSGRKLERFSGLATLAAAERFALLMPEGVDHHWNDGRAVERYRAMREQIDDVGYMSALIDEVVARYPVDPRRVYLVGASNGGMMTLRLACEQPQRFAAAAAVIANLPEPLAGRCTPETPLPLLMINGRDDSLVPWEGEAVRFAGRELGAILSAEQTFAVVRRFNRCGSRIGYRLWPEQDPDDGTRVHEYRGRDCAAESVLLAIEGGGHTWPGGLQYLPVGLIGRTSREFNASERIWEFFAPHRRER